MREETKYNPQGAEKTRPRDRAGWEPEGTKTNKTREAKRPNKVPPKQKNHNQGQRQGPPVTQAVKAGEESSNGHKRPVVSKDPEGAEAGREKHHPNRRTTENHLHRVRHPEKTHQPAQERGSAKAGQRTGEAPQENKGSGHPGTPVSKRDQHHQEEEKQRRGDRSPRGEASQSQQAQPRTT
jgi:hypothetical protein